MKKNQLKHEVRAIDAVKFEKHEIIYFPVGNCRGGGC